MIKMGVKLMYMINDLIDMDNFCNVVGDKLSVDEFVMVMVIGLDMSKVGV